MSTESGIVGYCRACGKALDESSARHANGTIYCEEHVKDAAAFAEPAPASPYTAGTPPPLPNGDVSPAVAFLLGWIPGVGAIYNGQYLKGLVHIFFLGLLFTAADHSGGPLVGLMIPGFWFYMAFEAYHTARRKREGLPVDDFSGLDIGKNAQFPLVAILLILFGVLFLLENLGVLELYKLVRLWPAGLIALGLYMLYMRTAGGSRDSK